MSDKDIEKMKELLEAKRQKQEQQNKFIPSRKMGAKHTAFNNTKNGGANNKV